MTSTAGKPVTRQLEATVTKNGVVTTISPAETSKPTQTSDVSDSSMSEKNAWAIAVGTAVGVMWLLVLSGLAMGHRQKLQARRKQEQAQQSLVAGPIQNPPYEVSGASKVCEVSDESKRLARDLDGVHELPG